MNALGIAELVLSQAASPLHVNEIASRYIEINPQIGMSVEDLARKLSSALSSNVRAKTGARFAKVSNNKGGFRLGIYRLKRATAKQQPADPEPELTDDTGFIGKAGEFAVMSELLFRKFNVSMMTVDKGIDLVAANESGKYFHIQVKTSSIKDGSASFSIKRKSFDANNTSQTIYVFVIRGRDRNDYLIMPNTIIANCITMGVIKGSDTLSIRIAYDSKTRKYTMNGKQDVTIHINRFGQIN